MFSSSTSFFFFAVFFLMPHLWLCGRGVCGASMLIFVHLHFCPFKISISSSFRYIIWHFNFVNLFFLFVHSVFFVPVLFHLFISCFVRYLETCFLSCSIFFLSCGLFLFFCPSCLLYLWGSIFTLFTRPSTTFPSAAPRVRCWLEKDAAL